MFQNILLPVDGSEHSKYAAEYAVYLAKKYESKIHVLHIIDLKALEGPFFHDVSASIGAGQYVKFSKNIESILEKKGREILNQVEKKLSNEDIRFKTIMEEGIISDKISEYAKKNDIIIMGNRGIHAKWGNKIFGSVFEAVIRQSNHPALVTNKNFNEISKIIFPYDGKKFSSDVLTYAANITLKLNTDLVGIIPARNNDRYESLKKDAADYLDGYKLTAEFIPSKGSLIKDLLNNSVELNCDLIMVTAYRKTRLTELVLGSKTETLLRLSKVPILLIR